MPIIFIIFIGQNIIISILTFLSSFLLLNKTLTQSFTAKKNVIVSHCKLHNDGSIDVSQDGTLLATYVPSTHGFPDNGHICVFSLRKENLGQCIYSRSYGIFFVLLFLSNVGPTFIFI